ncbi:YidC/Oxa1 family membrane protein insertase [Anaerovorax odorimutans]|uniref:YidC/Oxa1 family membrane protein insertase n=1 Tax=Anaerovorax odorimutans TaxID=109327 RepID=UPI00041CC4CC|nr:YidC/Oxa1 family membrane protein insertase [Anaerovorax odorimutans]
MYNTIVGVVARPLGMLLSLLYDYIGNYGVTLIVFTIIVRACLFPLYADQIKHSTRMADMQPKMKALQKKYANDRETLNIKMMELYKEEKFNPMRGCLPMLIQMPIIFGLFALLRNPMIFIKGNEMLMAIHESFIWIPDLSQPDPWVLPILAGITTYFSYTLTQAQNSMGDNNQMSSMMNMMKYFFPIMIVWMGRSFPAGLAMYWFIGTFIQVFQTLALNKLKKNLKTK